MDCCKAASQDIQALIQMLQCNNDSTGMVHISAGLQISHDRQGFFLTLR
jgi:hypothetical protein